MGVRSDTSKLPVSIAQIMETNTAMKPRKMRITCRVRDFYPQNIEDFVVSWCGICEITYFIGKSELTGEDGIRGSLCVRIVERRLDRLGIRFDGNFTYGLKMRWAQCSHSLSPTTKQNISYPSNQTSTSPIPLPSPPLQFSLLSNLSLTRVESYLS
jgi:hypothetical protein